MVARRPRAAAQRSLFTFLPSCCRNTEVLPTWLKLKVRGVGVEEGGIPLIPSSLLVVEITCVGVDEDMPPGKAQGGRGFEGADLDAGACPRRVEA